MAENREEVSRKQGSEGMARRKRSKFDSPIPDCRNYPYQEDPEELLAREKARFQILRETNTICPVCHRSMKHACHCPKKKAAVCEEHCETCEYHVPMTAASNGKCLHAKKPPAGTGGEG